MDDSNFNGTGTGGDGLSWSPVADVIAYPTTTFNPANPLLSGPTPISTFNSAGQFLGNLTSPTSGGFLEQFIEHDQFPTFSPDGQQLAYFRQRRIGVGFSGPTQLELRIAGRCSTHFVVRRWSTTQRIELVTGRDPTGL